MEQNIKILLIEDNPDYAQLIKRILSKKTSCSMEVLHCDTFSSGYEKASSGGIDLILLDLDLPDSGNINTLLSISEVTDVPIIVLTGTDDESLALKAVQMGAQDYLMKGQVDARLLVRSIMYAIERKKAEDAVKQTEERFKLLIENALDLIEMLDVDGTMKFVSPSHKRVLGYENDDLIGRRIFEFVHPEDLPGVIDVFNETLQNPDRPYSAEFRVRHKEGYWITLESIGKHCPPELSSIGVIVNLRDITERKKMEERLRSLSITDELTGLYNRRGFLTFADHHIKAAERRKESVLLILIDLDGLKQINDAYGHNIGDQALMDAAQVIKQTFRSTDVTARISGDEFVVVTTDSDGNGQESIKRRIEEKLKEYNSKGIKPYHLSFSYGVATFDPQDPSSIDRLLVKADELMYLNKNNKYVDTNENVLNLNRSKK
ncbi:MAG TPA: diguanylate cyclase [Thermodesulfobacteriota bacterium]|nr:diguanylate cyclase [Thermodesulfobacteriota bacterium]